MRNSFDVRGLRDAGSVALALGLLLAAVPDVRGQTWARTYDPPSFNLKGRGLVGTPEGDVVVLAYDTDTWVARLDDQGDILWEKTFAGNAAGIDRLSDGDFVIAGYQIGPDLWVLRLDGSGDVVCAKRAPEGHARAVHHTADGGFVVVGWTTAYSITTSNLWLLKFDASCFLEWQYAYGSDAFERGEFVQQTFDGSGAPDGFVVLGGRDAPPNGWDFWVLRLDTAGAIQWQRSYGGPGQDGSTNFDAHGVAIRRTGDGGFILGGMTESFGAVGKDMWLLKLDAVGDVQWEKRYGFGDTEVALDVREVPDGGYVVAGMYDGAEFFGGFWGVRVDASGDVEWAKDYQGYFGFAKGVDLTPQGGFVFEGPNAVSVLQVVKVDANGEIDSTCPFVDTPVEVVATSATILDTSAVAVATPAVAVDDPQTGTDTVAEEATLCLGRVCPTEDLDGDGFANADDNCPTICNPSQADTGVSGAAGNGIGDACDGTDDRERFYGIAVSAGPDGTIESATGGDDVWIPGCPVIWAGPNGIVETTALASDLQVLTPGTGQDCDPIAAFIQPDLVPDGGDNCPGMCNPDQGDVDADGIGDACCPGIVDYCISGSSSGAAYSWGFDDDGSGGVEVGEVQEQNAATPPVGSDASALASAFAANIDGEGTYTASAAAKCFTTGATALGIDLYVGAAGSPADCKVSSVGCSYNPNIYCIRPSGRIDLTVEPAGGGATDLSWNGLPAGLTYDVLRGGMGSLRGAGGDFSAAGVECRADDLAGTAFTSSAAAPPGDAVWFLVRAANCGGGTYDTGAPSEAASRDPGIAMASGACP